MNTEWAVCGCCGGFLPTIDNDHQNLPRSWNGGVCPGYITDSGRCGTYTDEDVDAWLETIDEK